MRSDVVILDNVLECINKRRIKKPMSSEDVVINNTLKEIEDDVKKLHAFAAWAPDRDQYEKYLNK